MGDTVARGRVLACATGQRAELVATRREGVAARREVVTARPRREGVAARGE